MIPVDLRSDTLTFPSADVRRALAVAEVGDDCFGEDRSVNDLEEYCADLFGKEAALLLPSGTMSNQIALRALVGRGDEAICDLSYHINFFEAAQTADLGGVSLNTVDAPEGILTAKVIQQAVESRARWTRAYATPRLVWLENTINSRGGKVVPYESLVEVSRWANRAGLAVYTDGARIFNASVATGIAPRRYGSVTTALSVCFAKGLGAPMGSVLIGPKGFIQETRRLRKWYGGALHQSGFIASACLYALKHNVARLADDHANSKYFAAGLRNTGLVAVTEPDSNMVMFNVSRLACSPARFVELAAQKGVKLLAWRGTEIRAVFSLNVSHTQTRDATATLAALIEEIGVGNNFVQRSTAQQIGLAAGARRLVERAQRVLVKVGSTVATSGAEVWAHLIADVDELRRQGKRVALVVSGAVALGRAGTQECYSEHRHRRASASAGQMRLTAMTEQAFRDAGLQAGQILIRHSDSKDPVAARRIAELLDDLCGDGVVPVLNEDDCNRSEVGHFADNDHLASWVGKVWCANLIVFLTDVDGVYDSDPGLVSQSRRVGYLDLGTLPGALPGESSRPSNAGTGGMRSKLLAAWMALSYGCSSIITSGVID